MAPGKHEGYYDVKRYEERVKRLGNKFLGQKKRDCDFVLSKFLKCHCGRILTGEIKKGKYIYYQHKCPGKPKMVYIPEDSIFNRIDDEVKRIRFSDDFGEHVKTLTEDIRLVQRNNRKARLAKITREIAKIESEQEELLKLYASKKIPVKILEKTILKYESEIKALENQRKGLQTNNNKFLRQVVEIIDTLRDMPVIYLQATKEEKAEIIRSMAHGIIVRGDSIQILWKKPYSYLLKNEILDYKKKLTTLKFENRQLQLPRTDSNCRPGD